MKLWNLKKTYMGDIPPRATVRTYCGAAAFRDACYTLVSSFLITYISFSGLLSTTDPQLFLAQMGVISLIIVICRIWDGLNDPIMGWIIEKFHFKWGKYKPWILIGGVLNTIVVLVLFLAHPTGWNFVILFGVFYFLWDIVYTINDIAYWSMLPSLTKKEDLRNKITSGMQVCVSVGVFVVYGVVTLLVGNKSTGHSAQQTYGIIAIVVATLFLLSQIAICVICKEHVRPQTAEEKERNDVRFKDMFLLFRKNDQFRVNIVAVLLNYLASGVVAGFAMYYCYLIFGYGTDQAGSRGGTVSFLIAVVFGVATLLAQALYPLLARKFTRKQLMLASGIILTLGYVAFFFFGFPVFGTKPICVDYEWAMYIGLFLLFFAQGIISVAIIMQLQSTIEYNEWKYGERKEAIVSSMRALVAKFGSAIQQGVVYATLAGTGLYSLVKTISDYESLKNAQPSSPEVEVLYNKMITALSSATQSQLLGLAIGMVLVPVSLLIVCIFLSTKVFKIDEKKYREIVRDLNKRKKAE